MKHSNGRKGTSLQRKLAPRGDVTNGGERRELIRKDSKELGDGRVQGRCLRWPKRAVGVFTRSKPSPACSETTWYDFGCFGPVMFLFYIIDCVMLL